MLGKKTLGIITLTLILTLILGLVMFYVTYQKNQKYLDLLSDLPSNLPDDLPPPSDLNVENLTPEYTELLEDVIDTEISVVSTGKFSDVILKSAVTGKELGHATVLDVVAKDSEGNPKPLRVIVQIFQSSSPSTDFIPWLANIAATTIDPETYSDNPGTASLEELSQIFNENSVWTLIPLLDFNAHKGLFEKTNQEFVFFARQYYGDDISIVKEFVESEFKNGSFDRPLLLMTVEWVK